MFWVREHIPLEQGLRREGRTSCNNRSMSQRAYSIRTRIKTIFSFVDINTKILVREHIPLEQGLRQSYYESVAILFLRQRAYSIRTRIKTLTSGSM